MPRCLLPLPTCLSVLSLPGLSFPVAWIMLASFAAPGLALPCPVPMRIGGEPAQQDSGKHPNIAVNSPGVLPRDRAGKELNTDFETGDLTDWKIDGKAFEQQPIEGEISANRPFGEGKKAELTGRFWIGGYEQLRDEPKGQLQSRPFVVSHPYATFLVGGGSARTTRVELVDASSNKVLFQQSGNNVENMRPALVDTRAWMGSEIFIRLVDQSSAGWGHLNFDDFRFHAEKPVFADPNRVILPAPSVEELYPHAGLDAEKAAEVMEVPPGFQVQLAATEPDVSQPIAMAMDDRGRLWIAEAYEYPIRAPEGQGRDRILIFEDTNGDGRLNQRKVFAENLNLVSGLEVGFGGVWVGAAPHFLFIPDRNGDDQPDGPPQVLLDGWGYQDTHETLNAFIWGPDGWLYGCHGVFTHSRVGKPGTPDSQRTPINAGIWRYHPLRHEFEVFAHGTSNPWGVDFDDLGQAFCTACVIPHLYHVIQGARYQRQGGTHFNPHTYDDIKTIARHRHFVGNQWNEGDRRRSDDLGGGHAHAGAMVYLGGAWPKQFHGKLFMHNIHGNRVNVDQLIPKGSGFEGDRFPDFLLTRDQWSQMINLRYGPDGQVWAIDWYDQNQCHRRDPNAHDRGNGRIFRIVYNDAPVVHLDLSKRTDIELAKLQTHANDWYVRHARRLLQERADQGSLSTEAVTHLVQLAQQAPQARTRLRAIWCLHGTGHLDDALQTRLQDDPSDYIRGWLIQLCMERHQDEPGIEWVQRWVQMARDDSSQVVRRYLASACQRLPREQRWDLLAALTQYPIDAADANLPLLYWYALEPLADANPQRALALAMAAGQAIDILPGFMIRRLGSEGDATLGLLVQGLLDEFPSGSKGETQTALVYVRGMTEALRGVKQATMPAGWTQAQTRLLSSDDPELRVRAAILAMIFGHDQGVSQLRAAIEDDAMGLELRELALQKLLQLPRNRDARLRSYLLSQVGDSAMGQIALRALAHFEDPQVAQTLIESYAKLPPQHRRDALATLTARAESGLLLLNAIESKGIDSRDLTADLVRQLRNLDHPELNQLIASVWGTVRNTPEARQLEIDRIKAMMQAADLGQLDVARGRTLFHKTCAQCHTLFGQGGQVGPDLTGSNRANLDYLLSNILDPSSVMAKEYQPTIFQLEDGRVITGIVRSQDANSFVVQTAEQSQVLVKEDVLASKLSPLSMMPEDLLKPFGDSEIQQLLAYLASPRQTPVLATPEYLPTLFDGQTLAGWAGNASLWRVEESQIIGRTQGLSKNEFLVSQIELENFRLSFDVLLKENIGNSGVQFRSQPEANGSVKGYQADIGQGWWGKLYEEHGRGLLWSESGEAHLKPGTWNRYEILARGDRIQTFLNGQLCVDLTDPEGAKRGRIALQLHSGPPMEVRFRRFQLEVLPPSP